MGMQHCNRPSSYLWHELLRQLPPSLQTVSPFYRSQDLQRPMSKEPNQAMQLLCVRMPLLVHPHKVHRPCSLLCLSHDRKVNLQSCHCAISSSWSVGENTSGCFSTLLALPNPWPLPFSFYSLNNRAAAELRTKACNVSGSLLLFLPSFHFLFFFCFFSPSAPQWPFPKFLCLLSRAVYIYIILSPPGGSPAVTRKPLIRAPAHVPCPEGLRW